MINWKLIDEYVNSDKDSLGIDSEPEILLYNERFGLTTGKAIKWVDGDIVTIANGYHNVKFTHFAYINLPN